MAGLPAAYMGSMTQHGTPLVGAGCSTNVIVHGLPAWTAGALHVCAVHGPETVGMGSETVLINGKRAARAQGPEGAGDFLQGGGPPNQIVTGANDVLIGTPAIGVATPENEALFCRLYCRLKRDWASLTPAELQAQYEAMLGAMFGTFGAPPPGTSQGLQAGAAASWDRSQWRVNVASDAWSNPSGPPNGDDTLHEIRHGEQSFNAMRFNGGTAPSTAAPAALAAAASQPMDPDSAEARMGSLQNDNEVSQPGLQNRNRIISELGAAAQSPGGTASARYAAAVSAYYNQPGGADAKTVEQAGTCGGCR